MALFDAFANPAKFNKLSRGLSPYLLGLTCALTAIGIILGLFISPEDYQQGHSVRIMYVHVPAAWMATMSYTFIAVMSAIAFVWRHSVADLAARAAAPIGLIMTGLALFTGALWGKPTWGTWWVWDARLTSVLVLFFIYIGYLAIWDSMNDKAKAAKFARIFALLGFVNVPIIKFSVDWWNSLHQPASIIKASGPSIQGSMLAALLIMITAYMVFFVWAVLIGTESYILETQQSRKHHRKASSVQTIKTAMMDSSLGEKE